MNTTREEIKATLVTAHKHGRDDFAALADEVIDITERSAPEGSE